MLKIYPVVELSWKLVCLELMQSVQAHSHRQLFNSVWELPRMLAQGHLGEDQAWEWSLRPLMLQTSLGRQENTSARRNTRETTLPPPWNLSWPRLPPLLPPQPCVLWSMCRWRVHAVATTSPCVTTISTALFQTT